jgi:hypothetical protein
MSALQEAISVLEGATAGSPELDLMVLKAAGVIPEKALDLDCSGHWVSGFHQGLPIGPTGKIAQVTTSIDAARALAPPGFEWWGLTRKPFENSSGLWLAWGYAKDDEGYSGRHDIEAVAHCMAALCAIYGEKCFEEYP